MLDIATLSAIAGLFMTGLVLLLAIVGGIMYIRSGVGKQADEAQQRALTAMQTELNILRDRVTDAEKENTRLHSVVDAIFAALEARGMIVTIRGKIVHIADNKGGTTTIQVSSANGTKSDDQTSSPVP